MANEKKSKKGGILTGMIVGGAVGSVLSLLFASEKGREKVKDISKKGIGTVKKVLGGKEETKEEESPFGEE